MARPIELIVACAENRVIGRAGRLPFDIPEDKQWFHDQTANQTVVLGRICFETWSKVTADGRQPVVISSQPERIREAARQKEAPALSVRRAPDAETAGEGPGAGPILSENRVPPGAPRSVPRVASTVPDALAIAQTLPGRIMICGGQRIYEETLPMADRILLTLVHAVIEGDTWFPEWRNLAWRETWKRSGADQNYRYTFSILERVR
jgi:dihydrofolate reductase